MGKRAQLSPDDFVTAATTFVEEHGFEALTMRALGEQMGIDPTAIYRHFPSKDELLAVMLDRITAKVLDREVPTELGPVDELRLLCITTREYFAAHPNLATMLPITAGTTATTRQLTNRVVDCLIRMGIADDYLVEVYQMLESYVLGSLIFDLGRAPEHLTMRRLRYRGLEIAAFDRAAISNDQIAALTTAAFTRGLDALIANCRELAR